MVDKFLKSIFDNFIMVNILLIFVTFVAIVSITALVVIFRRRHLREKRVCSSEKLVAQIKTDRKPEENLGVLLEGLSQLYEALSYGYYILDPKSAKYILKAVRSHSTSGLETVSSAQSENIHKEGFTLPSYVNFDIVSGEREVKKFGEVSLFLSVDDDKKSLILFGPVGKMSSKEFDMVSSYIDSIKLISSLLIENSLLNEEKNSSLTSENALKSVASTFTDYRQLLAMVLELTMKTISAVGARLSRIESGNSSVQVSTGILSEVEEVILDELQIHNLKKQITKDKPYLMITPANDAYGMLARRIPTQKLAFALIGFIETVDFSGVVLFWYSMPHKLKPHEVHALDIMTRKIGEIMESSQRFKSMSDSYVGFLMQLSDMVDNMKPNTVGYSKLMYRYAYVISKELGLTDEEVENICIASYLSNIGIVGLSETILNKKGKFTDIEYDVMKLHADVGASIIEVTLSNSEVADIIRYHHERIDGLGYPKGLIGDQIPIGSRIIAVLQTFFAKIIAREYRTALPFNQALEQLKSASGTQLDKDVVDALIRWVRRKQRENKGSEFSLGSCWDMRCSDESICADCPAYRNQDVNCWQHKSNNCIKHGNECSSCFIHTEFQGRNQGL